MPGTDSDPDLGHGFQRQWVSTGFQRPSTISWHAAAGFKGSTGQAQYAAAARLSDDELYRRLFPRACHSVRLTAGTEPHTGCGVKAASRPVSAPAVGSQGARAALSAAVTTPVPPKLREGCARSSGRRVQPWWLLRSRCASSCTAGQVFTRLALRLKCPVPCTPAAPERAVARTERGTPASNRVKWGNDT